ncbi:type I restriction endonuclease [Campylobacter mucosalis]|uniref:type I restriction endonuclease n=1 Tax=Campylobacter mucosalis TaxID=202 RepID=UPI0014700FC0|nr:type I restriction endonuclease [Campylobacter mucosalis]
MDELKAKIKEIVINIENSKNVVATEEATKNAFIMPFIQALGYNIFNPLEVVPEFTSDAGLKQAEKIDYAIMQNSEPILLIECKKIGVELNASNESQLLRYFHTSKAKFAILTNGQNYKFYTDLDEANIMDKTPFLSFDITKIKDSQINELSKFHKNKFDVENILTTASNLKYLNAVDKIIAAELENPSREFVSYFFKKISDQVATEKRIDQLAPIVKSAFTGRINDIVRDRLTSALNKETEKQQPEMQEQEAEQIESKIITTEEEIQAFHIVRAIACAVAPAERIYYRDAQSYFSVLFDDNRLKPICRLYLSDNKKTMVLFDKNKNEEKVNLTCIEDIYQYPAKINEIVKFYMEETK